MACQQDSWPFCDVVRMDRCSTFTSENHFQHLSTRLVELGASHCKSDNQQQICFLGFLSLLGLLGLACSWFPWLPWFPWFPKFLSFFPIHFIPCSCRRHKIEDGAILQGKAPFYPLGLNVAFPENDKIKRPFTWIHMIYIISGRNTIGVRFLPIHPPSSAIVFDGESSL